MVKYILKRLLIGVISVLVLTTVTFYLMHYVPGNPFSSDDRNLKPAVLEMMLNRYHLNDPITKQFGYYLKDLLRGDFGESMVNTGQKVNYVIATQAPVTLKLGLFSFTLAIVLGITFGLIAALTKSQFLKNFVTVIATIGVSLPSFLFSLMLMYVFSVWLKLLPLYGLSSPLHYIMPGLSIALYSISSYTRMVRATMTEVIRTDYITLARSKGLSDIMIYVRHGLKNAILPVITSAGQTIAFMLTGSFVIENLYSIPGIGKAYVTSVQNRDYTMIMGLTIYLGVIIVFSTILSDIISSLVDPRIRLHD